MDGKPSEKLASVLLQPIVPDGILGIDLKQLSVKTVRVIHVLAVAQLVNHHAVQHLRGCQQEQAVEIQISIGRTASPTGSLMANGDPSVRHTHEGGIRLHTLGKDDACLCGQGRRFLRR